MGNRLRGALLGSGLWLGLVSPVGAAGVVGSGTPASCTEAALDAALAGGGTVTFDCGGGPVTIPFTSAKTLTTTVTIDGTGQQVTLDGQASTRLFVTTYQFASFTIALRNLTVRNGRGSNFGGAIRLVYQDFPTTLDIDRVTFADNVAVAQGPDVGGGAIHGVTGFINIRNSALTGNRGGNGGAIGHIGARLVIEDTVFTGNATHEPAGGGGGAGGALYTDGSANGPIVIRRCRFQGNDARGSGGAIHTYQYAGSSSFTVEDSTFSANTAVNNAGAIYHQNGALTVDRSTFAGNTAVGQGGAIWLLQSNPATIRNSTFNGNDAIGRPPLNGSSGLGGAILINASSVVTISHSTIAGNHAGWVGGGITGGSGSSTTTLRGTIVANNSADNGGNPWNIAHNCSTQLLDGGFNIQFPNRVNAGDPNDPNCTSSVTIADPQLQPLADNTGATTTMALSAASPARDAVTSGCPPPSTDQRGIARPQGSRCDIGAYEAAAATVSIADRTVAEGSAVNAAFLVTLSTPSVDTVAVAWATADGTAGAGTDYTSRSGTLTFTPGRVSHSVFVPIATDAAVEGSETFTVNLSNPSGASIDDGVGQGTITDPPADATIPMYRAYNPGTDYHFFTTDAASYGFAVGVLGFQPESSPPPFAVLNTVRPDTVPLFRMYNPNLGRHYYTADVASRDFLMDLGMVYERDEGFVHPLSPPAPAGTVELFRLYNNNSGTHLFTADPAQRNGILTLFPGVWVQHTSVGYVFTSP